MDSGRPHGLHEKENSFTISQNLFSWLVGGISSGIRPFSLAPRIRRVRYTTSVDVLSRFGAEESAVRCEGALEMLRESVLSPGNAKATMCILQPAPIVIAKAKIGRASFYFVSNARIACFRGGKLV